MYHNKKTYILAIYFPVYISLLSMFDLNLVYVIKRIFE